MKDFDRPLRVVHIGTADRVGGAARAQWRMHEALLAHGVDSRILCGHKSVDEDNDRVQQVPAMKSPPAKLVRKLAHRAERLLGEEYGLLPWGRAFSDHPWVRRADVIHLHNLHGGYFPVMLLPALARRAPLVWSAHDLWPTTAHCYFPQMKDCRCWTGEQPCIDPRQDDWYPLKRCTSRRLWERKRRLVEQASPTFLAQSAFTERWLRDAPITRDCGIVRVPYALDVQTYRPGSKQEARAALGLPSRGSVVMFSAVSLANARKGGADVLTTVRAVADRLPGASGGLTLLTVGAGGNVTQGLAADGSVRVVQHGQVDTDRDIVRAYHAADVFLGASRAETFGQVFSEAAACGTPGVAYDTTGVADAIRHGQTGLLAPLGDVGALAGALEALLIDSAKREAFARAGREVCEAEYAYPVVARRLVGLYESRIRDFASLSRGLESGDGDA